MADLLLDGPQVVAHLRRSVNSGDWLDAYLFAAALGQLVDDDLHPDPAALGRAAAFLRSNGSRVAVAAAAATRAAADAIAPAWRTGRRHRLRPLVVPRGIRADALAGAVLDPATAPDVEGRVRRLVDRSAAAGELLGDDVLRLPAAFRGFDQHPDDVDRLAAATLSRHLRPAVPVCVVGVRTSGSYLAPLFAAALRGRGVQHVEVLTHRPHRAWSRDEVDQLQRVSGAGGRVVIVDDAPGSGSSLAATATAVARVGAPDSAIVLAACVFPDADPAPARLAAWAAVWLPWASWSVHSRLAEAAVGHTLAGFLSPHLEVEAVRRTTAPASERRNHVRAEYLVTVRDADGRCQDRGVVVEGVGLGWLGSHAIAVSDALYGWTPRAYGLADGLLFREATGTESPAADATTATGIAAYCAQRHAAFPVRRDPTRAMRGRDPVWEVAAALLAGMYGRLGPVARPLLLEPLTRRLVRVGAPSVVDGATDLGRWRLDPDRGLVKIAAHERAFSHLEAACYDPVFDLAGASTDPAATGFDVLLRRDYERLSGTAVRAETWLLYRLVHLWRMGRAGDLDATAVARRSAVAVSQFLAEVHLADVDEPHGPLCALDLDGVLESDPLGYPVTTPAGTRALRALITHGYRPVIATGRSVADARDRCLAFGLPGAVAEYGTVLYVRAGDRIVDLRSADQRALVDKVRADLAGCSDVEVDPGHRYAIRARSGGGPVAPARLAEVLRTGRGACAVVSGQAQTDVIPAGVDKAAGLATLGGLLGGEGGSALAVGDGAADVAMLAAASIAHAPANAAHEVRAAGVAVGRRAYQAGLSDAVAQLLGHRPGTCATCRPPRVPAATGALLRVLALRENGVGGLAPRSARLAAAVLRSAVTTRW